jgi:hypothetical protein
MKVKLVDLRTGAPSVTEFKPDSFGLDPRAGRAVEASLRRTETGFGADLRTPYGSAELSRDKLVNELDQVINLDLLPQVIAESEVAERDKIGPLSIQLPYSERRSSVLDCFVQDIEGIPDQESLDYAINELFKLIPKASLRPVSLKWVYEKSKKNTNWGFPYFAKGSDFGIEYLKLAKSDIDKGSITRYPSMLFWRGQLGGDVPKQRVVWGYPHHVVLIELTFLHPILRQLERKGEFCALSHIDLVKPIIDAQLKAASLSETPVAGNDVSKFDASANNSRIHSIFDAYRYWFQPQYSDLISSIEDFFVSSDMLTPEGMISGRFGGVPSGSGLTNITDSLLQFLNFKYTCYRVNRDELWNSGTFMGDDGSWFINGLTLNMLVSCHNELGYQVNPEKVSFNSDSVSFCQAIYHSDLRDHRGFPKRVRSLYRTLGTMISYEHPRKKDIWNRAYDSIRWISQLENASEHPQFSSLLALAVANDLDYGLGTTIGGPLTLFKMVGGVNAYLNDGGSETSWLLTERLKDDTGVSSLKVVQMLQAKQY